MMQGLAGKVAVITGAGSGIGRASALHLASAGARIVVADIDDRSGEDAADEIRQAGGEAVFQPCDVLREADIEAAVDRAAGQFGAIDIMFNNAAALPQTLMEEDRDILSISTEGWNQLLTGILTSVMLGCRYAVRTMLARGRGGSIINTSSMYGVSAYNRHVAYGTAKAGVIRLTQYVATAYGRDNIRCNAIAPSMITTPLLERTAPPELIELNRDSVLLPELGAPDDVASVVAFLASDAARYLTGQLIRVDGGSTAHLPTFADARRFYRRTA
jgi:NAD(P)-dependent dehydrogenase (short-subunit alcohol dehydrogenase family)